MATTPKRTTTTDVTRRLRDTAYMFDMLAVDSPTAQDCQDNLRRAAQIRFVAYLVKSGALSPLHGREWLTAARMTYSHTLEARKATA